VGLEPFLPKNHVLLVSLLVAGPSISIRPLFTI